MRDLLRPLQAAGFRVDFAVVRAGFFNDDDAGRFVSPDEVRAFIAQARDPELEPIAAVANEAELVERIAGWLVEPDREALAHRKWRWQMAQIRVSQLSSDSVDALAELEEFWLEWSYPGPHGAIVGAAWEDAERTLRRALHVNLEWLEQERAAILAADAQLDGDRIAS